MQLTKIFSNFFQSEKTSGILLVACTAISLLVANSSHADAYLGFWNTKIGSHTIAHWINDGLMTLFFLMIGLELEREFYKGELSNIKNALLPVFGALGGVLFPAGIYLALNYGTAAQNGAGIPMATDIAFAIGMLSILGKRVPASLKIFLTALAVIDDLLAIMVIAVFYTASLSVMYLSFSATILATLFALNRLRVRNLVPYFVGGFALWYCMMRSGIHPTLAGVLLAFAIPFGNGDERSSSYILQNALHKPVAFVILPLFALANTAIIFLPGWTSELTSLPGMGIYFGLVIGKPLGILIFIAIAVAAGICKLPAELNWKLLGGAGILAGIGFTMSIFVTLLAFDAPQQIASAKIAILFASLSAAILGLSTLYLLTRTIKHNGNA